MAGEACEVATDVYRLLGVQGAREDPHQRHPPDVGVCRGLDDLGDQRLVGAPGDRRARLAIRRGDRRHDVLARLRKAAADHLQKLVDAELLDARHRKDGVEVGLCDGGLQIVDQILEVHGITGQIPLHQSVIIGLGDHLFDQRSTQVIRDLHASLVGRSGPAHHIHEAAIAGEIQRVYTVPERLTARREGFVPAAGRLVQVRDGDRARHADGLALPPQHASTAVNAVDGRDHEDGSIRGAEAGSELTHVVGVTRGVEDRELDRPVGSGERRVAQLRRRDRQCHGVSHALLDRVNVADGGAVLHRPDARGCAAPVQQVLGQCRLP